MTATRADIVDWLQQGQKQGAAYMIVAVDRYDHDNYPIYFNENELNEFWERYDKLSRGENMQGCDEVYDFSLSLDNQLKEHRARNLPPRPTTEADCEPVESDDFDVEGSL